MQCIRHLRRVAVLVILAGCTNSAISDRRDEPVELLVVGTIHQRHARNSNYTYQDISHILSTYNPDVICVEIRPQDFRRRPYLKEMVLATVWGVSHGRDVYPIDWWNGDSTRQVRARLQEQAEYQRMATVLDSLEAANPIMSAFEAQYGDFWQGESGYEFFNSQDYNEYTSEAYRLSMEVYGDSPMNLYYETRNTNMLGLIDEVLHENPGQKVLVLTGAEHKHFFDRALEERGDISLVRFDEILPLEEEEFDAAIHAFLEEGDDLTYFEAGYPSDLDQYYVNKLIPLLHGPNMDWEPNVIPAENLKIAGHVVGRWGDVVQDSRRLWFELGWLKFLTGEYDAAVQLLEETARQVEGGNVTSPFMRVFTYRNLGLSYDMLGERELAIDSYLRAEELALGTRMERTEESWLKNYLTVPYQRPRTDH